MNDNLLKVYDHVDHMNTDECEEFETIPEAIMAFADRLLVEAIPCWFNGAKFDLNFDICSLDERYCTSILVTDYDYDEAPFEIGDGEYHESFYFPYESCVASGVFADEANTKFEKSFERRYDVFRFIADNFDKIYQCDILFNGVKVAYYEY